MITSVLTEHQTKHARLLELLAVRGADALLLSTPASLAWYLAGARTHVSLAAPPITRVLVHASGCEIATSVSEAARLRDEELAAVPHATVHALDWSANLDELTVWFPEATGLNVLNEAAVDLELRALRTALSIPEVERYRSLCAQTAAAFTTVLATVRPEDTESQVAAALTAAAVADGGEVLVALVSGESRASYRHPLPTQTVLGRRAMAVLCVRRHGLIANVTRWVRFGSALPEEVAGEADILAVEADILSSIAVGGVLGQMLPVVRDAYPAHGFAADEITRHHQGGIAGYNGRDPRLAPAAPDLFQANQAIAFNPSAVRHGLAFKVEDTMLLRAPGHGAKLEVLSHDARWPSRTVNGLARPETLQL